MAFNEPRLENDWIGERKRGLGVSLFACSIVGGAAVWRLLNGKHKDSLRILLNGPPPVRGAPWLKFVSWGWKVARSLSKDTSRYDWAAADPFGVIVAPRRLRYPWSLDVLMTNKAIMMGFALVAPSYSASSRNTAGRTGRTPTCGSRARRMPVPISAT
jgi:hypothetical protein